MRNNIYEKRNNKIILAWLVIYLGFLISSIKVIFVPIRVWKNVSYAEVVAEDGIVYGVYDCEILEYWSGKIIVYHDSGKLISNINDLKMYY